MHFRPGLYESLMPAVQLTAYHLNGVNAIYGSLILIVNVKVRTMVRSARLCLHANNDTKEARKFRQARISWKRPLPPSRNLRTELSLHQALQCIKSLSRVTAKCHLEARYSEYTRCPSPGPKNRMSTRSAMLMPAK